MASLLGCNITEVLSSGVPEKLEVRLNHRTNLHNHTNPDMQNNNHFLQFFYLLILAEAQYSSAKFQFRCLVMSFYAKSGFRVQSLFYSPSQYHLCKNMQIELDGLLKSTKSCSLLNINISVVTKSHKNWKKLLPSF